MDWTAEEAEPELDPVVFAQLDAAFTQLNATDHVVAVHKAGYTRQGAMAEVSARCSALGGSRAGVLGGVFSTTQDVGTAVEAAVLRLAYFAVGPDTKTCKAGIEVMMPRVLQRLREAGLQATWNGDQRRKIEIRLAAAGDDGQQGAPFEDSAIPAASAGPEPAQTAAPDRVQRGPREPAAAQPVGTQASEAETSHRSATSPVPRQREDPHRLLVKLSRFFKRPDAQ